MWSCVSMIKMSPFTINQTDTSYHQSMLIRFCVCRSRPDTFVPPEAADVTRMKLTWSKLILISVVWDRTCRFLEFPQIHHLLIPLLTYKVPKVFSFWWKKVSEGGWGGVGWRRFSDKHMMCFSGDVWLSPELYLDVVSDFVVSCRRDNSFNSGWKYYLHFNTTNINNVSVPLYLYLLLSYVLFVTLRDDIFSLENALKEQFYILEVEHGERCLLKLFYAGFCLL